MVKYRIALLTIVMLGVVISKGCAVRNDEPDSAEQLQRAQDAFQALTKYELMIAEADSSYQKAIAAYEKTLPGEVHRRGLKYLFIDLKHVQSMEGVNQIFHQPSKEKGPVIVPEHPWEGDRVDIWSKPVWSEELSRWQMWYWGGEGLLPMYAESTDGINWDKPLLGLVDWKGSSDNNIINLGFNASGKENRIVVIRDDLETDSSRLFKGLTRVKGRLIPLVSADGHNWTLLEGDNIASGDEYRLGYDALNNQYLATSKTMEGSGEFYPHTEGDLPLSEFGRRVSLSVSDDFVNWSDPVLIFWGDEVDQELGIKRINKVIEDADRRGPIFVNPDEFYTDVYNMAIFNYEDMYLGMPMIFNQSGTYPYWGGFQNDGILYPSLIASRDLHEWDRLNREPFIPHSKISDKNNFDHASISAMPPVQHDDELWFYFNGSRFTHLTPEHRNKLRQSPDQIIKGIFLARLRIDGFTSLHADRKSGKVLSVPIKVTGPRLYVNVDAGEGELRTEIQDAATGKPINGYEISDETSIDASIPISEDIVSVPVRWQDKKDVAELLGREVMISFALDNVHLYSFWFDD